MTAATSTPGEHRLNDIGRELISAVRRYRYRLRAELCRRRHPGLVLGQDVRIEGRLSLGPGARVRIGDRCRILRDVRFEGPGEVEIGPDCVLNGSWIGCWTRIDIGARSLVSDCRLLDNDFHNLDPARRHAVADPRTRAPIQVEADVWIGTGAMVLKGVRIGEGSVVGAATVVRVDVPPRAVIIGNPQRVIKRFSAGQNALPKSSTDASA